MTRPLKNNKHKAHMTHFTQIKYLVFKGFVSHLSRDYPYSQNTCDLTTNTIFISYPLQCIYVWTLLAGREQHR